jgi:hypothetical protein
MADRKWEHRVISRPDLPSGATSPMMDSRQMTDWLNLQDERGWELVSYGQTRWHDETTQEWWIFRRPHA